MNTGKLAAASVAALMMAGTASAATTLSVVGEFNNSRNIGVAINLNEVDPLDSSTWTPATVPLTFTLSGTITVDNGVVTGATLNAGPITQIFTQTGGVNPTEGVFEGLVYTLSGTSLVQAPGSGAGVTGSCTLLSGTAFDGCDNALQAWKDEADSRLTNWNGVPEGFTVNNLFGPPPNSFGIVIASGPGIAWSVGGLNVGDSVTAELLRNEVNPDFALFTSAFAGTLELTVVPVPAAVWLFASALGLIGFLRRRAVS